MRVTLLAVCIVLPLSSLETARGDFVARPVVAASMAPEEVFVGEMPSVRFTLTAPKDRAVAVVKKDRVNDRKALYCEMFNEAGKQVSVGYSAGEPVKEDDDFFQLEAGKSVEMTFATMTPPRAAGKYTVRLHFKPTSDERWVVQKELILKVSDIPAKAIQSRTEVKLPKHPATAPFACEHLVELLNVKTGKKCELIVRYYDLEDGKSDLRLVHRQFPLDETSRVLAVPKFYDRKEYVQEIWITYDKDGDLHFARLDRYGQVLENVPAAKLFPAPAAKKEKP